MKKNLMKNGIKKKLSSNYKCINYRKYAHKKKHYFVIFWLKEKKYYLLYLRKNVCRQLLNFIKY